MDKTNIYGFRNKIIFHNTNKHHVACPPPTPIFDLGALKNKCVDICFECRIKNSAHLIRYNTHFHNRCVFYAQLCLPLMSCGATVGASAANSNLIELKTFFYPCLY